MRGRANARRAVATVLTLSAGLGAVFAPASANAQPCEPTEPDAGYRMLFDGTSASLTNWSQAGPGEFVHRAQDCTIASSGGMGLLWHGEEFDAYRLRLDWKLAGDDNSGVFVGFPDPGDDPWVAADHGYEIQIDATDTPDRTTGAIYGFQAPDVPVRDEALNPPGEWNRFDIVVQGRSLEVYLNDVLINQFVDTDPERDLTQGFVGVQNHGEGDDIEYRAIQIRELEESGAG